MNTGTRIRTTHTFALLEISPAAYAEIREKLIAAGYQHAFSRDQEGECIDMTGIAVQSGPVLPEKQSTPRRRTWEYQPDQGVWTSQQGEVLTKQAFVAMMAQRGFTVELDDKHLPDAVVSA